MVRTMRLQSVTYRSGFSRFFFNFDRFYHRNDDEYSIIVAGYFTITHKPVVCV